LHVVDITVIYPAGPEPFAGHLVIITIDNAAGPQIANLRIIAG
jgi:hypothetical protein